MDLGQIMCVAERESKYGAYHVAIEQVPVKNALDGHDGVYRTSHSSPPTTSHTHAETMK